MSVEAPRGLHFHGSADTGKQRAEPKQHHHHDLKYVLDRFLRKQVVRDIGVSS
jgi:hypothetical protein